MSQRYVQLRQKARMLSEPIRRKVFNGIKGFESAANKLQDADEH